MFDTAWCPCLMWQGGRVPTFDIAGLEWQGVHVRCSGMPRSTWWGTCIRRGAQYPCSTWQGSRIQRGKVPASDVVGYMCSTRRSTHVRGGKVAVSDVAGYVHPTWRSTHVLRGRVPI